MLWILSMSTTRKDFMEKQNHEDYVVPSQIQALIAFGSSPGSLGGGTKNKCALACPIC